MSSNLEHFEGQENFSSGGILTDKYPQQEFVKLVSLIVTLLVAHALRLQLSGNLSLDGFNKNFMNSVGGLVIGQAINSLAVARLFNGGKTSPVGKYYQNDSNRKLIQDMLELFVLLGSQQLFLNVMTDRGFQISEVALRNMFLSVCGVLLYNLLVHPFVKDVPLLSEADLTAGSDELAARQQLNKDLRNGIGDALEKVMSLAVADYMSDLDFDNFQTDAGVNAAGVLVGELSSTPIVKNIPGLY